MRGGCARLASAGLAMAGCAADEPLLIQTPEVPSARSLLVAIESPAGLTVSAREPGAGGALFEEVLDGSSVLIVSFVYYSQNLEQLGLVSGPVTARDPLDPLPPFHAAYRLIIRGDEVGDLEPVHHLEDPLGSFLYPHPEGCTEVSREGRTLCVPNGCPGDCARDFCFDPPEPWDAIDSPYRDDGVAAVREGSEVWLYFVTSRWTASSTGSQGRGDHAKVRLIDGTTPDLNTLVRLDNLPLDALAHVKRPSVTRDGLELVFSALPAGGDAELVYLSHRQNVDAPFSVAKLAIAGLNNQDMMDPLVLLDPTIFLVWSGVPDKLTLFHRVSTEPGAVDFTAEISLTATFSPDPLQNLGRVASFARPNLSCDGWHLLVMRKFGEEILPSTTLVSRHSPLEFSRFVEVPDLRPAPGRPFTTWAEHPDCSVAYLSDGERLYVARRRACAE